MIIVGQKFQEARLQKNLTLESVSQGTKIKVAFLEAIEKGEYEKLPSVTYAQGFVRNYARFLNMPEKETLALFRREFDKEKAIKVLPLGFTKTKDFSLYRFKSKQNLFLVFSVLLLLMVYILFQSRGALVNPSLFVSSPQEAAVISSNIVTVIGKTDSNATVFVDNFSVSLDSNGVFTKVINVFPGKITVTIRVVNRFGKETIMKRNIEVKPGS
jgi:cytoskeletal protein RodZ